MLKNKRSVTRFCLPFMIKCLSCNEYIGKNKRFNTKQEEILEEKYYGIKTYRFIFKCTNCSSILSIKTDPKNGKYSTDKGCINISTSIENNKDEFLENSKNIEQIKEDMKMLLSIEQKNKKYNKTT
ncbi:hypothetical protein NCER_100621 [Vairimorpha ceranae BRL01]|uniref:Coiled-coil domain-containing protein 94 n=2 Tax=Vairimorpha ceranae TaxID=40302 RepID=C4V820_VAIC1|nr:coiled-coil domain-containing protein 94 [Vairimorpha ceranae]EEQ82642.1 hypothetical protein NCER_100621 [Vairimorpha ceranae BRL01]KAF5141256.1 hypothetical protein G9O61_00g005730 [Vairimorpha ceranae]KKO76113.1 coiled-coil domain-containing protein 94 [Vairimorpha ceranae]